MGNGFIVRSTIIRAVVARRPRMYACAVMFCLSRGDRRVVASREELLSSSIWQMQLSAPAAAGFIASIALVSAERGVCQIVGAVRI